MGKVKNIAGNKYGMLTVLKQVGFTKQNVHGSRSALWLCRCDCGNECIRPTNELTRKRNHSCGCLNEKNLENMRKKNITHGMTNTKLYRIYKGMKDRCYNPNCSNYNRYGGRGIEICDEWLNDKTLFFKWALDNGYEEGLSIERINVNGGYSPDNCCWIEISQQCDNKRQNIMIRINGEIHNATYWAKKYNVSPNRVRRGYKLGWSIEKIFNMPLPEPYEEVEDEREIEEMPVLRWKS